MADSDNSTTLSSVTRETGCRANVHRAGSSDEVDPAFTLLSEWVRAQDASRILCRLQQRLERRVLDAAHREATEERANYSIACRAEFEAMTAVLKLQDKLPQTPALSLLGIVAKLEMIAGADREIDDPTDFPWPHIASVLDDLKEIAGSLPSERPDRSAVHADCRRYQAMAADLVSLDSRERQ
ncbi:hypothetical protein GA829_21900 [Mesorhizobium sp. INR15]|nr:hypothetical protein GA829_21900 [Mesorhizobium sp. INR15]